MRLYHSTTLIVLTYLLLSSCSPAPAPTQAMIGGKVWVDGQQMAVELIPGSTVQEALDSLEIDLGALDRIEPPTHTVLSAETEITITRVWEDFEVEQLEIPFQQKRLPTELLPEGVEQFDPLQKGKPGTREITYRIVYEDGVEVSRSQIKSVVMEEPQDQIILFGTQQKYSPLDIPGRLVYLSQGNAVMFEGNTANRIPIVTSADLDGRVFSLSEDGEWLLFTRRGDSEEVINTLWAVQVNNPEVEVDLQVENVIHFADWVPSSQMRIAYSTVEHRQAAPGWQANNNLLVRDFSINGWVSKPDVIIDTNSGGIYGWWGTDFLYGPENGRLAFMGPDQIGFVDFELDQQETALAIIPLQTRSDWAWVPGLNWSPDGKALFTVSHASPPGSLSPEESPNFDLSVLLIASGKSISMVSEVGMFAYPLPSPIQVQPSGESGYQIAYLQAIFPDQSDTSRYRLMVMDRDGSNRRELFPPAEAQGIEPNGDWGAWSPAPMGNTDNPAIAVLYQGNIWLVDATNRESWQVTGDGFIDRVIWQ
ncbi:MAG: G5 domain-containing protein [Anaerolineales bacterium]|nr:G5 domain-containing protein [Anaerolineales bacterium]